VLPLRRWLGHIGNDRHHPHLRHDDRGDTDLVARSQTEYTRLFSRLSRHGLTVRYSSRRWVRLRNGRPWWRGFSRPQRPRKMSRLGVHVTHNGHSLDSFPSYLKHTIQSSFSRSSSPSSVCAHPYLPQHSSARCNALLLIQHCAKCGMVMASLLTKQGDARGNRSVSSQGVHDTTQAFLHANCNFARIVNGFRPPSCQLEFNQASSTSYLPHHSPHLPTQSSIKKTKRDKRKFNGPSVLRPGREP
jgi:hypothetical protein